MITGMSHPPQPSTSGSIYEVAPFPSENAPNPAGAVSLLAGIALMVLGVAQQAVLQSVLKESWMPFNTVATFFGGIHVVLAVLAIVTGAVGAAKTGSRKLAAGVGLGIGISVLVSVVGGFVVGVLFS